MAEQNFTAETTTTPESGAGVATPAPSSSTSPSDSGKERMDRAFADAWAKRGRENPGSSAPKSADAPEAQSTTTKPSGGESAHPTKNTAPGVRGESGEPADKGNTGTDDKTVAERKAFNRQQAAMRIARKQERQRVYQEEMERLNREKEAFEQEGENQNPTMAQVKDDQIRELQIQMVREVQAEWEREAREMFTPEDAEQFLKDTRTYGDWINQNEPELRQYIDKPYGRYLLKGWLDKVAKNPANADKWEAMNPYQKYQMLEKHYRELEKFGEDYAAGKVQIGVQQQQPNAQPQPQTQQTATPQQRDVPVPGSGRNTNIMPPSDNWDLMFQSAENKRKK